MPGGAQADCGSEDLYPVTDKFADVYRISFPALGAPISSPHPQYPVSHQVHLCSLSVPLIHRQGLTSPLPAPPLLPSSLSMHLSGTRFSFIPPSLQRDLSRTDLCIAPTCLEFLTIQSPHLSPLGHLPHTTGLPHTVGIWGCLDLAFSLWTLLSCCFWLWSC